MNHHSEVAAGAFRPDGKETFSYLNGDLLIESTKVSEIANVVGTPFYVYSQRCITEAYRNLEAALSPLGVSICFAVKANSNLSVLRLLGTLGAGMDIVSAGELERSLAAGIDAGKIIFSGVGKKRTEIATALQKGIHQLNVESAAELNAVIEVARHLGIRAPVALRMNPDVDALTHGKISTGRKGDKFGIPIVEIPDLYAKAQEAPEIDAVGIAVHIGSQLLDLTPYHTAYSRVASLVCDLRSRGLAVTRIDLGGGLGISYDGNSSVDIRGYAAIIGRTVGHLGCELTVEPGRWLVGEAGLLVSEVLYLKHSDDVQIAVVDAAMNDLMRPALYAAHHPVLAIRQGTPRAGLYRIVGPVCESSDVFGSFAGLPELASGNLIAFSSTGAYGASMSSTYNARELVPEVLVDGERFTIVRRRQSVSELIELERDFESVAQDGQGSGH